MKLNTISKSYLRSKALLLIAFNKGLTKKS